VVSAWWQAEPAANIAIRTGGGLCVVDVDEKPGKEGGETLREWCKTSGAVLPETIEVLTGGGGRHLYFAVPKGVPIPTGTDVLGPGVDVRGEGGYVLAPTSNHKSGRAYEWESSNDPTDDSLTPVLASIPPTLLAALQAKAPRPDPRDGAGASQHLPPEKVAEIRSALAYISSDNRDTWVQVGMALESTRAGEQAFGLWNEWSQTSEKYDAKDQRRVWRSFKPDHGITLSSLYWTAQGCGWVDPGAHQESVGRPGGAIGAVEGVGQGLPSLRAPEPIAQLPGPELLTVPGVLGEFVEWMTATAIRPQPQFAVQTALALGAVACGRIYCSDRRNWSSVYLLNVGPSGCGKEHSKSCLDQVLYAADQQELVNGAGYTSTGAVFSAMRDKPAHITVIDEIGRFIGSATSAGNHHRVDVLTTLMEAFGRTDGMMQPATYSTMGLSADQRAKLRAETTWNPSITVLGLTTPRTFYSSLSSAEVRGGFLNRFLIVESAVGRVLSQDAPRIPPPGNVVAWVRRVRQSDGNLPAAALGSLKAIPRTVPFSPEAMEMSHAMERGIHAQQAALTEDGLDDMLTRTREVAMRLAVTVAVSCDPVHPVIRPEHFGWARDYVLFYAQQTLRAVQSRVADSKFEAQKQDFLAGLRDYPDEWVSERDMGRRAPFKRFSLRERADLLAALLDGGYVERDVVGTSTKGGRPSVRWRGAW
jgi:hypothetical protein